jgi:hypothetical protein
MLPASRHWRSAWTLSACPSSTAVISPPAGWWRSQAEAGDSVGLLLGKLALLGFCQPNGCPLDLQVVATAPVPTMIGATSRSCRL